MPLSLPISSRGGTRGSKKRRRHPRQVRSPTPTDWASSRPRGLLAEMPRVMGWSLRLGPLARWHVGEKEALRLAVQSARPQCCGCQLDAALSVTPGGWAGLGTALLGTGIVSGGPMDGGISDVSAKAIPGQPCDPHTALCKCPRCFWSICDMQTPQPRRGFCAVGPVGLLEPRLLDPRISLQRSSQGSEWLWSLQAAHPQPGPGRLPRTMLLLVQDRLGARFAMHTTHGSRFLPRLHLSPAGTS